MSRSRRVILVAMFAAFFVASYVFVITNIFAMYGASIVIGVLTIPVTAILYRKEVASDFSASLIYFIVLVASLVAMIFLVSIIDPNWGRFIPGMFITPVLIEEFNFRYLLQRFFLNRLSPYSAVFIQAIIYSVYYSRYLVSGPGFPFPYNIMLITSMLGMGLLYGLLSKISKNFFLPATIHIALLSLLPWLPPAIASSILPA